MSYYPIFLDIQDKRCIIVGGGAVALRKVNMLLDHGARVEVISPEICSELQVMITNGKIKAIQREYEPGDIGDAFLVVAATDSAQTNAQIAGEASQKRILVNVVDVPRLSNFIVPPYLRRGDVTIAVSTNGKSPALARKIRTEIEKTFGEEYAMLTSLIDEVRSELKQREITLSGEVWQQALELDVLLDLLRSGQRQQARESLLVKLGVM